MPDRPTFGPCEHLVYPRTTVDGAHYGVGRPCGKLGLEVVVPWNLLGQEAYLCAGHLDGVDFRHVDCAALLAELRLHLTAMWVVDGVAEDKRGDAFELRKLLGAYAVLETAPVEDA